MLIALIRATTLLHSHVLASTHTLPNHVFPRLRVTLVSFSAVFSFFFFFCRQVHIREDVGDIRQNEIRS